MTLVVAHRFAVRISLLVPLDNNRAVIIEKESLKSLSKLHTEIQKLFDKNSIERVIDSNIGR
jgi:hypothetical protein